MVKLLIVKKIRALFSTLVLLVVFLLVAPSQAQAAVTCSIERSGTNGIKVTNFDENGDPINSTSSPYKIKFYQHDAGNLANYSIPITTITSGETPVLNFSSGLASTFAGLAQSETTNFTFDVFVVTENGLSNDTVYCQSQIQYRFEFADETDVGEFELCKQIADADQKAKCDSCFERGEGSEGGIWTAVGCIKRDPKGIVQSVLQIGLGISGGVALLMILSAAFLFSTSQGDVKRTTEARELMSSAVIGLLFIIFSITILQFIGVTIFHIPGFASS